MAPNKKQIYIVDDDESICRAFKVLLATFGFEVTTFLSSEAFFGAVPDSAPGCLILDVHMPGLDGWAALERLTASGSRRPVIIITADKNGGVRERAMKNGAAGFFQKPINGRDLVEMVQGVY